MRARFVRPWVCVLALASGACGGAEPVKRRPGALHGQVASRPGEGPRTVVVRRATGNALHLSLWVDAGSRDAEPPELATLAVWLASERAGQGVRGRAFADASELALTCERQALTQCLRRLARGLGTRQVSEEALQIVRNRLDAARRKAAKDPVRAADALALHALFGRHGAGFQPLGRARVATRPQAVSSFLARHYGRRRALVVAVGDLAADVLAARARLSLASLPRASAGRAQRRLPVRGGVEVMLGGRTLVSVAVATPELASAANLASALAHLGHAVPIETLDGLKALSAHALPVRGGALALARFAAYEPVGAARELAFHAARLRHEPPPAVPLAPPSGGASVLSEWVGLRWAARPQRGAHPPELVPTAIGLGLVAAGRDQGSPKNRDPDAAERVRLRSAARRAVTHAQAHADPEWSGTMDERSASLRLSNGAGVEVRHVAASDHVAVNVRFAGGAGEEPASLHGRTALLATLSASACTQAAAQSTTSATFRPLVEATSWGITASAPGARWAQAIDMVLRCALHPPLAATRIARARLRLRERLGPRGSPAWHASQAARLIAPLTPALCAPWGSSARLNAVSRRDLELLVRTAATGARVSVAAVGSLPAEQAALRIARRLSRLPDGTAAPPQVLGEAARGLLTSVWSGPHARVVVAWRTLGPNLHRGGGLGARTFADRMARALRERPGVRSVWQLGVSGPWGAGAAVGLDAEDAALSRLDITVAEIADRLDRPQLQARVRRAHADRMRHWHLRSALPEAKAERLAEARLAGSGIEPSAEVALRTLEHLFGTSPRFVIAREKGEAPARQQAELVW
ncbi:MAG: hypothetical protein MJD61_14715 [Proteobacteria bacterium]|nr:hypothetical protein [Pseudomonadota bacterium]